MIPKGNQRGGGQQLAAHLLNDYDNDRAEVADLRGAVAPDLHGAFAEWHAQAKATKCRKYLYSLSLNPDPAQGTLTRDQYLDFIARAEKRLGLENQPRAVVFHVKHGREHCHVAWSRIDTENMRAVQLSHDHQSLRRVAQEFARDHGLELPEGMKKERGADRFEDRQKQSDHMEKQQEERSGFGKAARLQSITDAWNTTRTGEEFMHALRARDYFLARGERGYVVVDLAGEIHNLSRQVQGVKGKAVRERLGSVSLASLPDIEAARETALKLRVARREKLRENPPPGGLSAPERYQLMAERQAVRRLAVERERDRQSQRHAAERTLLDSLHLEENTGIRAQREKERPHGALAFLRRITGIELAVGVLRRLQDGEREKRQSLDAAALGRRQTREAQEMLRNLRALDRLDGRERRSLETSLRREDIQRLAALSLEKGKQTEKQPPALTTEPPPLLRDFREAAQPAPKKTPLPQRVSPLRALFNRLAAEREAAEKKPDPARALLPGQETLRDRAAPEGTEAVTEPAPSAAAPEAWPEPSAGSLAEQFRRAADRRDAEREDERDPERERHWRPLPRDRTVRR